MFSRDPTAAPSQRPRPPKGAASNPALCKQCNDSLRLDDSFLKPLMKVSATGKPYLGGNHVDQDLPRSHQDDNFLKPVMKVSATGEPYLGYLVGKHADQDVPDSVCGGIDYVRYDQIPTLPDLSLAADSGCAFCAALREGLKKEYQESPWWKPHPEPLTLRIQYKWDVGMKATNLDALVVSVLHPELEGWECPGGWDKEVLQFLPCSAGDKDPCTKWLGLKSRLCDNPWSPQNIAMSQRWIDECVNRTGPCQEGAMEPSSSGVWPSKKYDSDYQVEANATAGEGRTQICQPAEHSGGAFLPARLLDLFPVYAHTPGCISLVESIHLEKGLRYAALSYCWGNVEPTVMTTRATLDSHQQGIKFSALPQCLRDAVTVARSLEIRYLWIDALCIIQGDGDDWARESATMWQLFQNAYLTIAAAASESFDEGFLARRPFEPFEMDFMSALNFQVVGKFTLSTISDPHRWQVIMENQRLKADLRTCKWNTRGWVFQEQQSSKRLLVFGKHMLHFQCVHHCVRSENSHYMHHVKRPVEARRGTWTGWLVDYTQKHFTFLQDKLAAVSGLSKQIDQNSIMRGEGPAQYLAGIWYCVERRRPREGWQQQLFWRLETPGQSFQEMLERLKCTDLRTYTAPSWSWASRGEGAHWLYHIADRGEISVCPSRFEAKIEDHQMNLTGPDPTGRVGPGSYLKISGLLDPDPLDLRLSAVRHSMRESDGGDYGYMVNEERPGLFISPDWNHSPTDQEDPLFECDIRLFGLWMAPRRSWGSDKLRGLLLLRDSESGLYFRVGSFGMDGTGKSFERWERQSIYIL